MYILKFSFIFFTALFCFNSAFSQDTRNHKAFLSLYGGTFSTITDKGLFGPAAGFGWQNKKQNWHEAEFDLINIAKDYGLIWFKYQHSITLFKNNISGFKPFIGLGLEETAQYFTSNMYVGNGIRERYTTIDNFASLYASPGIQYTFPQNGFYTALQLPTDLVTVNWQKRYRRNSEVELNALPFDRLVANLSFGYKF